MLDVRTFTGAGFGENAYLAVCEDTGTCVVVDPGAAAPEITRVIREDSLILRAVLLTHAHFDHIEGVAEIRSLAPDVPIWLHPADLPLYHGVRSQAALFGIQAPPQPEPTDELVPGTTVAFGGCGFEVRFTPGHAPGHVILVTPDHRVALVGDVVFHGSIGRTDLPGGDFQTLMKSIRTEILTLPDEAVLYPGHGPPTTVRNERETNPFLVPNYGGELA